MLGCISLMTKIVSGREKKTLRVYRQLQCWRARGLPPPSCDKRRKALRHYTFSFELEVPIGELDPRLRITWWPRVWAIILSFREINKLMGSQYTRQWTLPREHTEPALRPPSLSPAPPRRNLELRSGLCLNFSSSCFSAIFTIWRAISLGDGQYMGS